MTRTLLLRGVSAGALTLAVFSSASFAQEALPTIDIGAAAPARSTSPAPVGEPTAPIDKVAQPPAEDNITYRPENAMTATKTNTPIMETPASIQVVPRAVLEDEKVTVISQAANNVSGVIAPDGRQAFGHWIRGFLTYTYYLDGVRMDQNSTNTSPNLANIDRVEILKGPASILYGRGEPGGLINLVSKQPLEKPYTGVEQQIGSWSSYRTSLDTTGPLTKDNTLLYRLNLAWEDGHYFQINSYTHDFLVAPTLRWNIDPHTYLNVYATYNRRGGQDISLEPAFTGPGPNSSYPWYAFAFGTGATPMSLLPRQQNLTQPWNRGRGEEINVGYHFSHDLNEDWNLRHRFHVQLANFTHLAQFPSGWNTTDGVPFEIDNFGLLLPASSSQSYYTNVELTGKFNTFGLDHTLLVGSDYQHFNDQGYGYFASSTAFGGVVPPTNVLFPIYSPSPTYLWDPTTRFDYGVHESWWGVFVQDQMKLPYNLFLLAGTRYDHVINYDPTGFTDPTTGIFTHGRITSDKQKVTPRFGLLWRPIPEISIYGSYLTNFGALPLTSTSALPPESAQQWEVGVKAELLDNRLTATLAYYDLTKQNIPVPTDNTGLNYTAVGEARNRGVELDVAGEILPGWRVIGSYSYIASIITKDAVCVDPANFGAGCVFDAYNTFVLGNPVLLGWNGNVGKRFGGVPRNSGSLWTTYEIQDGDFRGLKFGGGMIARSLAQGDNLNDFHTPGYATLALMAAYSTNVFDRKVTFQLNVDNLLDTRYYSVSFPGPGAVIAGAPRSFKGSVKVEF